MPAPPPFACRYSANVPELLNGLGCTLVLSTYQAGKLVFLSAVDDERLVQLPRNFRRAMAVGLDPDRGRMAVAALDEVVVLANAPGLARRYPRQPDTYDAFFAPRASYYTGQVDVHGLGWDGEGRLWGVVTLFSCLATIDDTHSFVERWRPPFVSALAPEDRCHLNGMALDGRAPAYVTCLGTGDEAGSWRRSLPDGGALLHAPTGEVVRSGLSMPHSPRLYDGELYLLLSATGEVIRVERDSGRYEVVTRLKGFVRGMARCGDHIFVGRSRLRQNSSTFRDLPIAKEARSSGVTVIHLPTGAIVATIDYESSVDEIFDVQVIEGARRPGLLNPADETHRLALTTPESTFWAVKRPTNRRSSGR